MSAVEPVREPSGAPVALHHRAAENIRFIRDAMEGASQFTGVSGWGEMVVGLTALAAAPLAARQPSDGGWLAVWLAEAALAWALTVTAMVIKARRTGVALLSKPGRRFALGLTPPLAAGALLTLVLFRSGQTEALPGVWLLLYGTAVVTGGASSIRTIQVMGASFMLLGTVAFFTPAAWDDILLAAGFGGLHLAFGAFVAWRHGG